jgi:hypothetical protein
MPLRFAGKLDELSLMAGRSCEESSTRGKTLDDVGFSGRLRLGC